MRRSPGVGRISVYTSWLGSSNGPARNSNAGVNKEGTELGLGTKSNRSHLRTSQYSVFSNVCPRERCHPQGPKTCFKGMTTATSGVLARFSPAPPCPELFCELRGLCRHSNPGSRTCGRSENQFSSGFRGLNPGFQRNLSPP